MCFLVCYTCSKSLCEVKKNKSGWICVYRICWQLPTECGQTGHPRSTFVGDPECHCPKVGNRYICFFCYVYLEVFKPFSKPLLLIRQDIFWLVWKMSKIRWKHQFIFEKYSSRFGISVIQSAYTAKDLYSCVLSMWSIAGIADIKYKWSEFRRKIWTVLEA